LVDESGDHRQHAPALHKNDTIEICQWDSLPLFVMLGFHEALGAQNLILESSDHHICQARSNLRPNVRVAARLAQHHWSSPDSPTPDVGYHAVSCYRVQDYVNAVAQREPKAFGGKQWGAVAMRGSIPKAGMADWLAIALVVQ
jgi:hypothetical protein